MRSQAFFLFTLCVMLVTSCDFADRVEVGTAPEVFNTMLDELFAHPSFHMEFRTENDVTTEQWSVSYGYVVGPEEH